MGFVSIMSAPFTSHTRRVCNGEDSGVPTLTQHVNASFQQVHVKEREMPTVQVKPNLDVF